MPYNTIQACTCCYGLTQRLEELRRNNSRTYAVARGIYEPRIIQQKGLALEGLELLAEEEKYSPRQMREAKEACLICTRENPKLTNLLSRMRPLL